MTILSRFSKGIKQSAALSFGLSAKTLCDKSCQMLKRGLCYAEKPELRYKDYYRKLIRHRRMNPVSLLGGASKEVSGLSLKWFRFSVSGSVPSKHQVKNWNSYKGGFRLLCEQLLLRGVKIHLPVESMNKARSYRAILQGLPIVVRRTIQNKKELESFTDNCAYVIGEKPGNNSAAAFTLAKELRQLGKTSVVCPAVIGDSKCGRCTACSSDKVDLIIYPLHL